MNTPKFQIGEKIFLNDLYQENPEEWSTSTVVGIIADITSLNQLTDDEIAYLYVISRTGLYKHKYSQDALISVSEYESILCQWREEQEEIKMQQEYEESIF